MCLSYPAQVISVDAAGALVRGEHRDYRASTLLVPDVGPGDYVIVGAGTILERIEPAEAAEITALLDGARAGDPPAAPGSVVVIGIGNELRADDGTGPAIVARLREDPRFDFCRFESVHQLTPEMAAGLESASLVVFVDASTELAPGDVRITPAGRASDGSVFSHRMTPGTVIELAERLYGASPEALVVGVGIGSLEAAEPLSAPVEAAIPRAVEQVGGLIADRLRAAGGM